MNLGEHLFPAGYQFAFARFMESKSPTHFEARNLNPAAELPADGPFHNREAWAAAFKKRYDFTEQEINGDKVLEKMGPPDPKNPNPLLEEYCRQHGIELSWTTFTDARYLAKRERTRDGEAYLTAWDGEISKVTMPGDGPGGEELERLRRENEELRAKLLEEEDAVEMAGEEERAVRKELAELKAAICAQLDKVIIPRAGGGRPMGALREIAKMVVGSPPF